MITQEAYLMGRDKEYPPTPDMLFKARSLLVRVNSFFMELGMEVHDKDVSSGYRPGHYNRKAGGTIKSGHLKCEAIDLFDEDRTKTKAILKAPHLLEKYGLYMENPRYAASWVHLDIKIRNKHIFIPY